jgi:hypothetical protein
MGARHTNAVLARQVGGGLLYQRCVELGHVTAPPANEVIVRSALRSFVVAMALAQRVFLNQAHLLQHAQASVHRGKADVRVLGFDPVVQSLRVEVSVARLQRAQDQAALASQSAPLLVKQLAKRVRLCAHNRRAPTGRYCE